MTWELLASDGSVTGSWREAYNLCRVGDRFMVYASTDGADHLHLAQVHRHRAR